MNTQAQEVTRLDGRLGISGARKIAALAEASHVGVMPHNPLSAVLTAACLQIAATAPNFELQEFPNDPWDVMDKRPDTDSFLAGASQHDGEGFLTISDEPGIGITLRPDTATKYPYRPRKMHTRLHVDGSVVDRSSVIEARIAARLPNSR